MATIVTRSGKGSALTHQEMDDNFTNLNTDKLENVVEDTTPQLGGDLDTNGNAITATSNLTFDTASTERMRIDSSGILSVGTTDNNVGNNSGSGNDGVNIHPDSIRIARSDYDMFVLNLLNSTSGKIAKFNQDGVEIGNIGTYGGDMILGTGDTGLRFVDGDDAIIPANASTQATRPNAVDLGSQFVKWKDLFLSGGVYVGGTGSANHLDDYEEGTWTPAFVNGTVTYGNRSGVYTKVGGLVQASFMVSWTALSGLYEPRITLPFNATSSTNYRGSGAVGYMKGVDFGTSVNASWITTANQGDVNLVLNYDNATPSFGNINDWSSSGEIQGTIVYRTNS